MTFSQDGFINNFDNEREEVWSVDLKDATDRFPISFIAKVLNGVLPKEYVDHWVNLMVSKPFSFKGEELYYSVGNPMGAYSSWASFALAHHYVVYYCLRESGLNWKNYNYCLLGDDIVLTNKRVGEIYFQVMKELGVEISLEKTHRSNYLFEFAKRYFYRSNSELKFSEITPFPVSSLKETSKRFYTLTLNLVECEGKSWVSGDIPLAVHAYHKIIKHHKAKFCLKMYNGSYLALIILMMIKQLISAEVGVNTLLRRYHPAPQPQYFGWRADYALKSIIQRMWQESVRIEEAKFGQISAEHRKKIRAIFYPDPNEVLPDWGNTLVKHEINLVYSCSPIISVTLRVIVLRNQAMQLGAIRAMSLMTQQWPLTMRRSEHSQVDEIFNQRKETRRYLAAYTIGKRLCTTFGIDPVRLISTEPKPLELGTISLVPGVTK